MARIVVDNTTPEGRQRQLEARVQVAFAKAASSILHALSGAPKGKIVEAMREFVDIHDAAEQQAIDPAGVAIRMPKLDRGEADPDEHINAILRGSLRMVAAILEINAHIPVDNRGGEGATDADKDAYDRARDEIVRGLALLQARIAQSKQQ